MVWITVKVQSTDPPNPADFAVCAVKEDLGEWRDVPLSNEAIRAIVLRKNPKKSPEELIAEGEIRMNVAATDVAEFFESKGKVSSEAGSSAESSQKFLSSRENEVGPLVTDLLARFSTLLAKEVRQPIQRPKPSVFQGSVDKLSAEVWLSLFERFVEDQDDFGKIMIMREYLTGVASTW